MKGTIIVTAPTPAFNLFSVKSDSGNVFNPNVLNVRLGDTVFFQLAADINAVEVSKTQYDNGGSTSNGGFLTPNGGGKVVMTRLGTLYYVSEKYSAFGMKGIINVRERGDFYIAKMTGTQEEFPVLTMGSGQVRARVDGDTLYLSGSFKNLGGDYTNSHFHRGLAGITGGVQIATIPTLESTKRSGTYTETINKYALTSAQKAMIVNREFYFNVHSSIATGGEIRGQLVPESEAYYHSNLMSSNEIPPIVTPAHGSLFIELNGDKMVLSGSAKEIASGYTNSHLHLGYAGQSGGVSIALKPSFTDTINKTTVNFLAADNTFTLTPNQLVALKAHQLYGNIHSTSYPAGEMRGQVAPVANARFRAYFSGASEPVAVTSQAFGGIFINVVDSVASVSGAFSGLESDLAVATRGGAHIHQGMAGRNGGIQYDLKNIVGADKRSGTFLKDSNTVKLTSANIDDLIARRLYANVHSLNNPGGEMRGQIVPEVQNILLGYFNGMQENRAQLTTGRGNVVAEINGTRLTLSGSAERLLDKINRSGYSHIHRGYPGQNGPVNVTLAVTHSADSLSIIYPASSNGFSLSTGFLDSLRKRQTYVNIHTSRAPGGEIRAQLLGEATGYYHSILAGEGETNPVNTRGTGGLMAELQTNRNVIISGSFANLDGKWNGGSHIHLGLPGTNGGVRYNLNVTPSADTLGGVLSPETNTILFTAGSVDSLRKRAAYGNIHTTKSPGGEIRGNFHNMANAVFTARLNGLNEVPSVTSAGNGAVKAELNNTTLTVVGSFSGLTGEFNRAIGGGAHIHAGANGVNGVVALALKTNTNADNKGGQFVSDSNVFVLTTDQLLVLGAGGAYANIHTTTSAGGEIRGQLLPEPNNFPTQVTISSPKLGDTIKLDLKGKDSTASITWGASTDPDGNPVVYKLQTALLPDFSVILNTGFIGNATSFTASIKSIDSTVAAFGIPPGGSITIPTRIVASDGSLNTNGVPSGVTFMRVISTGVHDEFVKSYSMILFPVPAHSYALLEVNAIKAGNVEMRIIDLAGRLEHQQRLSLQQGINRIQLDVSNYTPGTHFIQMFQNGKNVAYFKMVKQ
jgi:plastocyanin